MTKFLPLFLLLTLLFSCKKKESDLIWEKGFGSGEAFTVKLNSDSGYYA